jgi:F0F1-type ATP synthase gamma subunit
MNKIQASGYDMKNITLLSVFKINTLSTLYEEIILFFKNNNIKIIHVYYTEAKNISNRFILNYFLNINYNDYQIKKNFSIGFSNVSDIICPFIDFTLKSLLYNILNQSLFAEQGARFIAMDAALKNTRDSIEKNKKLYFKVRQQKINTQLQDLVASLL